MILHLPEDTMYDLFNDRTLLEMIDSEETTIETKSEPTANSDTQGVPDGPTEQGGI